MIMTTLKMPMASVPRRFLTSLLAAVGRCFVIQYRLRGRARAPQGALRGTGDFIRAPSSMTTKGVIAHLMTARSTEGHTVNKKHISSYYDESDDEDFVLLGSRFIRTLDEVVDRKPRRRHRDPDMLVQRAQRNKPRPVRDRTY